MNIGNVNDTQNKEIVNNLIDGLKLNPITDAIPRQVIATIQPTYEAQKTRCNVLRTGGIVTSSGNTTIYTTPSDKDFYLTSLFYSYTKDAAHNGTSSSVIATTEGTARYLATKFHVTGVVENDFIVIEFPTPVKIDRGTTIYMSGTFGAGTMSRIGTISGFTEEGGNNLSV